MQRVNLRANLIDRNFTIHVALENADRLLAWFQPFQPHRRYGFRCVIQAFGTLLFRDFESQRHN
jgi:hypothetical protein